MTPNSPSMKGLETTAIQLALFRVMTSVVLPARCSGSPPWVWRIIFVSMDFPAAVARLYWEWLDAFCLGRLLDSINYVKKNDFRERLSSHWWLTRRCCSYWPRTSNRLKIIMCHICLWQNCWAFSRTLADRVSIVLALTTDNEPNWVNFFRTFPTVEQRPGPWNSQCPDGDSISEFTFFRRWPCVSSHAALCNNTSCVVWMVWLSTRNERYLLAGPNWLVQIHLRRISRMHAIPHEDIPSFARGNGRSLLLFSTWITLRGVKERSLRLAWSLWTRVAAPCEKDDHITAVVWNTTSTQ